MTNFFLISCMPKYWFLFLITFNWECTCHISLNNREKIFDYYQKSIFLLILYQCHSKLSLYTYINIITYLNTYKKLWNVQNLLPNFFSVLLIFLSFKTLILVSTPSPDLSHHFPPYNLLSKLQKIDDVIFSY